jgi:hypothetical protein
MHSSHSFGYSPEQELYDKIAALPSFLVNLGLLPLVLETKMRYVSTLVGFLRKGELVRVLCVTYNYFKKRPH